MDALPIGVVFAEHAEGTSSCHRHAQRRLRPHRRREGPSLHAVRGPPVPALPARPHDRGPSRGMAGADGSPDREAGFRAGAAPAAVERGVARAHGQRCAATARARRSRRACGRGASRRDRAAARRGGPVPAWPAPAARHRDLSRPGLRQESGIADPLRQSRHAARDRQAGGSGDRAQRPRVLRRPDPRPRHRGQRPPHHGTRGRGGGRGDRSLPGRQPRVPLHQDPVAGLDGAGHRARGHRPGHHPAQMGRGGGAGQREAVPGPHRARQRHAPARRRQGNRPVLESVGDGGPRLVRERAAGKRGPRPRPPRGPRRRGARLPGGLGRPGGLGTAPGPDASPGRRVSRGGRGGSRPPERPGGRRGGAQRPGRHRAGAHGGAAPPVPEARQHRPAGRRNRPRLQQPPHRDPLQRRVGGRGPRRRAVRRPRGHRADPRGRGEGPRPDPPAARLRAAPGDRSGHRRPERHGVRKRATPAAPARRDHSPGNLDGTRSLAGPLRPVADGAGALQPGGERPGRHARRRVALHPHRERPGRSGAARPDRGELGPAPDPGLGERDVPRGEGAPVRALLHHQAVRRGYRPRPGHGLRHRAPGRRPRPGGERSRKGHHLRRPAATHRPDGHGGASPPARGSSRRNRDRAARRGRPRRPRGGGAGPPVGRLSRDRRRRRGGCRRGPRGRGESPQRARHRRDHAGHHRPGARRDAAVRPPRAARPLPLRPCPGGHRAARRSWRKPDPCWRSPSARPRSCPRSARSWTRAEPPLPGSWQPLPAEDAAPPRSAGRSRSAMPDRAARPLHHEPAGGHG